MLRIFTLKTTEQCWEKVKETEVSAGIYHVHKIDDTMLLRCIFAKLIYTFNEIIKISGGIFVKSDNINLNLHGITKDLS